MLSKIINKYYIGRAIGLILLLSAISKLISPQPFYGFIEQLGVRAGLERLILSVVLFVEICSGFFAVLGYYRKSMSLPRSECPHSGCQIRSSSFPDLCDPIPNTNKPGYWKR